MARQPKTNTNIDGYNYFRTSLTIGYDSKGKRILKQFYGTTKTEAENKKRDYLKAIESGINPDLASQTLEKAMHSWLWDIERHSGNKSSTFERYESIYRNYIESTKIGHLTVSDIKKLPIQKYYNELLSKGKSYSQIKNLHKLLNKFFGYAASEDYIIKNPLTGLKIPKGDEEDIDEDMKHIETLSDKEIKEILKAIGNEKLRYIIMFAVLTGARMGEILALEKSDIVDNIVKINKSVRTVRVYDEDKDLTLEETTKLIDDHLGVKKAIDLNKKKYHYELKVTKPKTKNSNREVPLPQTLVDELKKLNILVKEERLKLGRAYTENNLLFPSLTGTYIDSKNLRRSWERALKNAGVEYKKFHALRHTYATRLFENETSILTVSRLLGHSSIKTTEIYTHVLEDIKVKEVECLNSIFN